MAKEYLQNLLFYCKQLQYLREVGARAVVVAGVEPCENPEVEEAGDGNSSSSSGGNSSDQDNGPPSEHDTGDNVANKGTQVRPKVKSRKSQAALNISECPKCAERKLQMKNLQKQNSRLQSQVEKWKETAQRIQVSASCMLLPY